MHTSASWVEVRLKGTSCPTTKVELIVKGTSACRPNDHHLQVVAHEPLNQVTRNHKNRLPVGPRDSELPPLPSLFICEIMFSFLVFASLSGACGK